jgi:hypothetical protein
VSKRLEKLFDEMESRPIDSQKIYDKSMEVVARLIDNLAERIEWHQAEHKRLTKAALARGERSPAPVSMAGELETLNRIIANLNGSNLDAFRRSDPDAGITGLVDMLIEARKEHGNVKEENSNKEAGEGEMPEAAPEIEGDKISQNPTPEAEAPGIERGPKISRLCLSRGKIRRGSG